VLDENLDVEIADHRELTDVHEPVAPSPTTWRRGAAARARGDELGRPPSAPEIRPRASRRIVHGRRSRPVLLDRGRFVDADA
jgi:hypothetical protein